MHFLLLSDISNPLSPPAATLEKSCYLTIEQ